MFIAEFVCSSCKLSNKQELIFKKRNTIIACSFCKSSIITVEKVNGCFVVVSNKLGLVQIIYSPLDYKTATKEFNARFKGKPQFKIEAIFISENQINEQSKIDKNRILNKLRSLTKDTFFKIEASEAILIVSQVLKRQPEWVYNREYMTPYLPGFKS